MKNKKHAGQPFRPELIKSHNPTAIELAFRRAESEKKKDVYESKTAMPIPSESKFAPKTLPSIGHRKSEPQKTGHPHVKPAQKTAHTVQHRKAGANLPLPKHKRQLPQKTTLPTARERPPVKLGLKPTTNKIFSLNAASSSNIGQTLAPEKPQIIKWAGKSQVHGGYVPDESDIVFGFDFGTSSSKIVIRDSGRQTAHAIPFNFLACSDNKYLVPTRIFINDDGNLSLSGGEYSYSDLKIHLMDNPEQVVFQARNTSQTITAAELAAGYMALVIFFARAWFLKKEEKIYKKTRIFWHINLGIPSSNYGDLKMRKTFKTIAMAAWRISRLESTITIADVKKYLKEAERHIETKGKDIEQKAYEDQWIHPDFVNTHPEVIMEVVGYARSPMRTDGLHLIVDVGATTLDVATFIIHKKNKEDVYPLMDTTVERLGTLMLHNERIEAVITTLERALWQVNSIDQRNPLPDHSHYGIKVSKKDVAEQDDIFFDKCANAIGSTVQNTKRQRDPFSDVWHTELPVFVCGGGGRHALYRKTIVDLGQRFGRAWNGFDGFTIKDIPKPPHLDAADLAHDEYDRLAVAYGLSFTADEIGEVVPESQTENIIVKTPVSTIENRYVSKEMC